MVVRIRLARFGRKNEPFYRIFVADSRAPRDGKHIEVVGHFDPLPGRGPGPMKCAQRASAADAAWCPPAGFILLHR